MGSPKFKSSYADWIQQMERRDIAMYENIMNYCAENDFERAVFLVGAAHRSRIIELSQNSEVEWNYDGKNVWYPEISE